MTIPDSPVELPSADSIVFRDLGRIGYAEALELQRRTHAELLASSTRDDERTRGPMTVYLLEHDPPVITVSRRPGAEANLIATPTLLAQHGVTVAQTDRGGDITYHGPGQLVAYPILDLNRLGLRIHSYMRLLEEVVIETIAEFGVEGRRDPSATGVWVGDVAAEAIASRKICAMGVRVSRWVTMHGLALNVSVNLDHFGLIVPCGLVGRKVTSLASELGASAPSMNIVKRRLAARFMAAIESRCRP